MEQQFDATGTWHICIDRENHNPDWWHHAHGNPEGCPVECAPVVFGDEHECEVTEQVKEALLAWASSLVGWNDDAPIYAPRPLAVTRVCYPCQTDETLPLGYDD